MANYSIKDICNDFWKLERELNLFENKVSGIYFWELVRLEVYNSIINTILPYGNAHTVKLKLRDKIKAIPMYAFNSFTKSALKRTRKEILIFDHPRKVLVNNQYIDIYTNHLVKELEGKCNYEIFESDYLRKHWTNRDEANRYYLDCFYLYTLKDRLLTKVYVSTGEDQLLKKVEDSIYRLFNCRVNLKPIIISRIKDFKLRYSLYDRILKLKRPKKIYLVVSYGYHALIAAAKDNGIETIEIQHGTITKYHLGYSFPNVEKEKVHYFPDNLYLFGEYWGRNVIMPLEEEGKKIYGFPYLKSKINTYLSTEKNKRQVLFLSQGTIGKQLSEIAFNFATHFKEHQVIYKLHPGEYDRWKTEYPALVNSIKLNNFEVIDNGDIDLYKLQAKSEYQVGVNSTAIFEGLMFSCKTILINLPGIEYMEDLINEGYAILKNKNEISNFLNINNELNRSNLVKGDIFYGLERATRKEVLI